MSFVRTLLVLLLVALVPVAVYDASQFALRHRDVQRVFSQYADFLNFTEAYGTLLQRFPFLMPHYEEAQRVVDDGTFWPALERWAQHSSVAQLAGKVHGMLAATIFARLLVAHDTGVTIGLMVITFLLLAWILYLAYQFSTNLVFSRRLGSRDAADARRHRVEEQTRRLTDMLIAGYTQNSENSATKGMFQTTIAALPMDAREPAVCSAPD